MTGDAGLSWTTLAGDFSREILVGDAGAPILIGDTGGTTFDDDKRIVGAALPGDDLGLALAIVFVGDNTGLDGDTGFPDTLVGDNESALFGDP